MRILITGGTGYIGRHLVEYWQQSGHSLTVLARKVDASLFDASVGIIEADITNEEDVQAAIIFLQPEVVIHSAAMSKPNECEEQKEACFTVNVTATEYIAEACKAVGAKLIFLSTDFVFGHHGPYREDDAYDPVNYYGRSKVLAEEAVKRAGVPHAIVRTVLVFGPVLTGQKPTFLHWVKNHLSEGRSIRVYTDQQRSATYVPDLCRGIHAIVETQFEGIIHLGGEEVVTPFSLAQKVARHFGYDEKLLHAVTRQEQPEAAVRPENAVLHIAKAKEQLGYTVTPIPLALNEIFGE